MSLSSRIFATTEANVLCGGMFQSWNGGDESRRLIRSRSYRVLQREPRREHHAGLADQRHAFDLGATGGVVAREAAGDLPAAECESPADGLGVLIDDHIAAPLAVPVGVVAGVVEIAVA